MRSLPSEMPAFGGEMRAIYRADTWESSSQHCCRLTKGSRDGMVLNTWLCMIDQRAYCPVRAASPPEYTQL